MGHIIDRVRERDRKTRDRRIAERGRQYEAEFWSAFYRAWGEQHPVLMSAAERELSGIPWWKFWRRG